MRKKIKTIIFLPLAFLALGIINLAFKYLKSDQSPNLLTEQASADVAVNSLFSGIFIDGGCNPGAAACSGACCCGGCCCGCA